jgi:hypothetical protein
MESVPQRTSEPAIGAEGWVDSARLIEVDRQLAILPGDLRRKVSIATAADKGLVVTGPDNLSLNAILADGKVHTDIINGSVSIASLGIEKTVRIRALLKAKNSKLRK